MNTSLKCYIYLSTDLYHQISNKNRENDTNKEYLEVINRQ